MDNIAEELNKIPYDEFIEMKAQIADIQKRDDANHRANQRHLQALEKRLDDFEALFAKQKDLVNARIDNADAKTSFALDMFGGGQQGTSGNGAQTVITNGIKKAHGRIDALLMQLSTQVDRSEGLKAHAVQVACHCTHNAINASLQKLRNRVQQVRCIHD